MAAIRAASAASALPGVSLRRWLENLLALVAAPFLGARALVVVRDSTWWGP